MPNTRENPTMLALWEYATSLSSPYNNCRDITTIQLLNMLMRYGIQATVVDNVLATAGGTPAITFLVNPKHIELFTTAIRDLKDIHHVKIINTITIDLFCHYDYYAVKVGLLKPTIEQIQTS